MNLEAFNDYIQAQSIRFLDELEELIAFPSVAAQHRSIEPCADWLVARLATLGAKVQHFSIQDGSPIILAEIGTGPYTLMVYNHYDVQPETPAEEWDTPPFSLTRQDGLLIGRGTADDKGELLARIQAVETWLATQGPLPIRIKFIYEGEEEIGSVHLAHWVHEHRELLSADGLLWEGSTYDEAGRYQIAEGCKGIAYFELHTSGPSYDLHSSLAPIVPNPAWRLVQALSTLKDAHDNITLDGIHDYIRPMPEEVLAQIDAIPFEAEKMRENFGLSRWLNDIDNHTARRRWMLEPTITICGLYSGYIEQGAKTIVPAKAMAKIDCRLVPDLTPEIMQKLLRQHLDKRGFTDVEIVMLAGEAPAMQAQDSLLRQATYRAYQQVLAQQPILVPWFTGSGPMYPLSVELGIPVVAAGATWHPQSRAHAPNENIYERDYFHAMRLMGALMGALGDLSLEG